MSYEENKIDKALNFLGMYSSFEEIKDNLNLNEEEYTELLNYLLKHITLVPEEQIKPKIEEADKLLGKVDPDDVVFLATAFSIENSKIWSDDPHLEKQNKIRVFKTKHIVKLFFPEEK